MIKESLLPGGPLASSIRPTLGHHLPQHPNPLPKLQVAASHKQMRVIGHQNIASDGNAMIVMSPESKAEEGLVSAGAGEPG